MSNARQRKWKTSIQGHELARTQKASRKTPNTEQKPVRGRPYRRDYYSSTVNSRRFWARGVSFVAVPLAGVSVSRRVRVWGGERQTEELPP